MRELTGDQLNSAGALLRIANVSKRFGGLQVLEAFDLEVGASELLSIIGPNGCGKTTLFNIITGALAPDRGNIVFQGLDIVKRKPYEIARMGISRKFQVPGIYPELTVEENIAVPLAAARQVYQPTRLVIERRDVERAEELLVICRLAGKRSDAVSTLSHGERQLLEIAMVLATEPKLILLDEPTAGMTLVETENTAGLVRQLRDEFGKTVIVIELDMRFVEKLDCPVAVMLRGKIASRGTYREIQENPEVIAAYLGRSSDA